MVDNAALVHRVDHCESALSAASGSRTGTGLLPAAAELTASNRSRCGVHAIRTPREDPVFFQPSACGSRHGLRQSAPMAVVTKRPLSPLPAPRRESPLRSAGPHRRASLEAGTG
jgi:hypothetical protein